MSGQKIVHVLTTVHHGGAERVVLELARRQRGLGADVQVLCLQDLGGLLPSFAAAGIPVTLVPGGGKPGALRMAWRVAGALRTMRATVVHTHNSAPQITAGLGQRLRPWRGTSTALVHTEHGRLGDLRPSLLRWRRWTARVFDALTAVSADARDQMREHGIASSSGVDVILNGVDLDRFRPQHPSRGRGTHLIHVGRLDTIKGQDVLLAALPAIRARVPAVRLTIVGDGPARASLERQARELAIVDIVSFAGAIDDVRPLLQEADIFVLPSRSEGISIALLEAMASALPVVATDVGGNREVIDSSAVGTLVASEQPAALADAIVALLQDPERARAVGAAARRRVESHFSNEQTVEAYALQYRRAVEESAR